MIIIDTDALLDFLHNREPGKSLFMDAVEGGAEVSVVTWIEALYGIRKRSKAPKKREKELSELFRKFSITILPISGKIGDNFVNLKVGLEKKGRMLADFDLFIAATAVSNNLVLATRNKKHFERTPGLKLFS